MSGPLSQALTFLLLFICFLFVCLFRLYLHMHTFTLLSSDHYILLVFFFFGLYFYFFYE